MARAKEFNSQITENTNRKQDSKHQDFPTTSSCSRDYLRISSWDSYQDHDWSFSGRYLKLDCMMSQQVTLKFAEEPTLHNPCKTQNLQRLQRHTLMHNFHTLWGKVHNRKKISRAEKKGSIDGWFCVIMTVAVLSFEDGVRSRWKAPCTKCVARTVVEVWVDY